MERFLARGIYSGTAGYHQNKEHWNTVVIDGTVPEDTLKRMIAESYDLVSDSPTQRIYQAVRQIPRGKVATYGDVAAMAGNPRMARAVGNALHHNPDRNIFHVIALSMRKENWLGHLLWWGKCAGRSARADGIEVKNGRVDLKNMDLDNN